MMRWLLEKFVGTEISRNKFRKDRIVYAVIVVGVTIVIFGPLDLFNIIESLFDISKQPWYSEVMAKISFFMISVRIFFLSLFTKLNNPLGRLKVAFIYQFIGLIGGVVINFLLNEFVFPSQNVPPETKVIFMIFPYLLSLMMFVLIRRIYTDRNFDERNYLQTDSDKK